MKKLSVCIIALLCVCASSQALIVTNSSYNKIGSSSGGEYNDFQWEVGSYSDVVLSWNFDQTVSNTVPSFRMSTLTDTGRVVWVNLTTNNSDIAVNGTNIMVTLVRTNMPYRNVYDGEVQVIDANQYWTPVSRGKIDVTQSLFDPALTNFNMPTPNEYYVLKAGDFTQFTSLGGTAGQVWESDGAGGGAWGTSGAGDVVGPASAVNNRIATFNGTTGKLIADGGSTIANITDAIALNSATGATLTASVAQQLTQIDSNVVGIAGNDTDIANMVITQQTIKATADSAMSTNGGTFNGSVYTVRDFDTMAPASDELPSAGWVRSLSQSGQQWFFTTNLNTVAWKKTANFFDLETETQTQFTNTIASVASSTYLAGGITTQLFGSVRSPMGFVIYLSRSGGNPASVLPVHPEIYYVYNGQTNQLGDWEVANQIVSSTSPAKFDFIIPFDEPTLTGAVQIVSYLKSGTVSGSTAGMKIYGGGIYPSHMDISAVDSGESFADSLHINGDNAMTGNFNGGGNALTNVSGIDLESPSTMNLRFIGNGYTNGITSSGANLTTQMGVSDDEYRVRWGSVTGYEYSPTEADWNGNNLTNVGAMTATGNMKADSVTVTTGGVSFATMNMGKLGGTNGVYFNRNSTNYWISFGTTD